MAYKNDDIERYHKGLLSSAEMHALEKKALSDPFLADALEGAASTSPEEFSGDLQELKRNLEEDRSTRFSPLRIAASVIFLIAAGSLFYFLNTPEPSTLALQDSEPAKVKVDSSAEPVEVSPPSAIALAKPEESKTTKQASGGASSKAGEKMDQARSADQSKATQLTSEAQPSPIVIAEEEKTADEIVAERDKVTDQTTMSGAGAERKKEAVALRSSKAKLVQDLKSISGKVTSAEDGSAMPGVNVMVNGSTEGTVTNAEGYFSISTLSTNPELVYSFIGKQTLTLKANRDTVNVKMEDDVTQLSEVVVTGFGLSNDKRDDLDREPVVKMAMPKGGFRAYNKYLQINLRYPEQALQNDIKGKVTVQFTITTGGTLTEFNVLKGIGYGCDDEVIRLVKEGPKWIPTTQDNVAIESEVRVRVKFDPKKK